MHIKQYILFASREKFLKRVNNFKVIFCVVCFFLQENASLKEQLGAFFGKSIGIPVKNVANGIAICALLLMVAVNFNVVR